MNLVYDWNAVAALLESLYSASEGLEDIFPGRKFTLDGHLVGSIGEVTAAYMFGLELLPASSMGHDAKTTDGQLIELKLTQGRQISIRHAPDHLIALRRPKGGPIHVVYNGPGEPVWSAAGLMQSNGQRPISVTKLTELDRQVNYKDRLPVLRPPPI